MKINNILKQIFIFPIKFYSYIISPWLGASCRYEQTCSSYFIDALEKHGIIKGFILGIKRISSCHPYSKKSFSDKVPDKFAWKDLIGYKRKNKH